MCSKRLALGGETHTNTHTEKSLPRSRQADGQVEKEREGSRGEIPRFAFVLLQICWRWGPKPQKPIQISHAHTHEQVGGVEQKDGGMMIGGDKGVKREERGSGCVFASAWNKPDGSSWFLSEGNGKTSSGDVQRATEKWAQVKNGETQNHRGGWDNISQSLGTTAVRNQMWCEDMLDLLFLHLKVKQETCQSWQLTYVWSYIWINASKSYLLCMWGGEEQRNVENTHTSPSLLMMPSRSGDTATFLQPNPTREKTRTILKLLTTSCIRTSVKWLIYLHLKL